MAPATKTALLMAVFGVAGFAAGRKSAFQDHDLSAPEGLTANVFHCEKIPRRMNDSRLCYAKPETCAGKDAKPCFERPRAWCYHRSMGGLEWSLTETIAMCFPTSIECEHDHAASGTGLNGPPPVKGPCVEAAADEAAE